LSAWILEANSNLKKAANLIDSPVTFKNAIFAIWSSMNDAPDRIRNFFRFFGEKDLQDDASSRSLESLFNPLRVGDGSDDYQMEMFRELAVRLRCIEQAFYAMDDGGTSRSQRRYKVNFKGNEAFFLNRAPKNRIAKDGDPFFRRAFERSRIIPGRIGDFKVLLETPNDAPGRARASGGQDFKVGAGLFNNLTLSIDTGTDKGFVVKGVECANQFETISTQLAAAATSNCAGVVYPELTIDDDTVARMQYSMAAGEISTRGISFVIAGSWHVEVGDGRYVNQSVMLDASGTPIAKHRKLYRFLEKNSSYERIEGGQSLTVTVLGDMIISSAICLDFCNIFDHPPFDQLDVDLLLVPSCGGVGTMGQHIEKAEWMSRQSRVKTVVVQQHYDEHTLPSPPDAIGYLLGGKKKGIALSGGAETEQWSVLTL